MMIRSAPPASAHLADKPVPAPAPTRRSPCATVDRILAFQSVLSCFTCFPVSLKRLGTSGSGHHYAHRSAQFQEHSCRAIGKDRVVDIGIEFDDRDALLQVRTDGLKAGMVGIRIPKGPAGRIQH